MDKGDYWAYYSIVIVIVSQGKANYFGTRQLLVDSNDCVQFYSCFFKPNKTKSHMGKTWSNWTLMVKTGKRLSLYIQSCYRIRFEVEKLELES